MKRNCRYRTTRELRSTFRWGGSAGVIALALLVHTRVVDAQSFIKGAARHESDSMSLRIQYDQDNYFNEPVAGQRHELRMTRRDLRLTAPIYRDDRREWSLFGGIGVTELDTDARFPDTFDRMPDTLWNLRIGANYREKLDNDWTLGVNASVGSPSDRPFASGEEIAVTANGYVRIPHGERNAWMVLVNYANNRDFAPNVPLPGLAYHFVPSDQFSLLAGVPLASLRWKPADRWTIEASYFVPRNIHALISYEPSDAVLLFAGFDWTNQRFFRHDRRDDDDRLFYFEKRVEAGVQWEINQRVSLEAAGGWAFDRFWFEGEDYGDRGDNRVGMGDGPVVRVQCRVAL